MKYKIGDKVRIKEEYQYYTGKNTTGVIVSIDECGLYHLDIDTDKSGGWTGAGFDGLVEETDKNTNDKKEVNKNMKFNIVDYKVYNNKVVVVKFDDGTDEKATCCENDVFDLERGVEVCIMKHIMGTKEYNKVIKDAMKQIGAVDKAKKEKKQQEEMLAKKRENARKKKAKTRENRRQRRIADMK